MHTYSHTSEEHVHLIMRVEHRSNGSDVVSTQGVYNYSYNIQETF